MQNLLANIPTKLPDELVEVLVQSDSVRVERIVSRGHTTSDGSWYDEDRNELVVVLSGAARLRVEDESLEMRPGDWLNIPAHARHRVEWTAPEKPTVWLAVHYD